MPVLTASAVVAEEEDLAGSSDLDDIEVTDDDIPGRKRAAVRIPSLYEFGSGLVGVFRLPWDILSGAMGEDGRIVRAALFDAEDDAKADEASDDDAVLSFDDLDNATSIAVSVAVRRYRRLAGTVPPTAPPAPPHFPVPSLTLLASFSPRPARSLESRGSRWSW